MNLDIRWPICLLFICLGVILVACGIILPQEIYQKSLNINVNLIWGIVLLVFSGLMRLWMLLDDLKDKKKLAVQTKDLKDLPAGESGQKDDELITTTK